MNTLTRLLFILTIAIAALPASGQDSVRQAPPDATKGLGEEDSIVVRKNGKVVTIESYAARYDPRKAMLLAAVFPGAGQAYNKKYWKIPLVYGGFFGLGYAVWWNQGRYNVYRKGLFSLLNEPTGTLPAVDPNTGLTRYGNVVIGGKVYYPIPGTDGRANLSLDVARVRVNKFRRDRDYALIMSFLFYLMQMVDAHVDAHLKEFDVNPQLKVSIEPTVNQNAFIGRSSGVGLTLKFK
jgi:hypothetical protein